MTPLYPLRFEHILRRYLWGGRRLASELGKSLPHGDDYAESWEIVDRGADQSVVMAGPLAGTTLHELVSQRGRELLGRHYPQPRFPLLLKLLDAQRTLSVQVHPNDEQGAHLASPDFGKTEAWVVLAAQPGSLIYAGLKDGVDRKILAQAISDGHCETCLHVIEPHVGECIFLPAGVVHAIGEGLVVAEIQQSSDTTFRLFDWNRTGPDGKPRPLHVDAALDVTRFEHGPVHPQTPVRLSEHCERLVACDKFMLDRLTWRGEISLGGGDVCRMATVVEGSIVVENDAADKPLVRGDSMLLPASVGAVRARSLGETTLLVMQLP